MSRPRPRTVQRLAAGGAAARRDALGAPRLEMTRPSALVPHASLACCSPPPGCVPPPAAAAATHTHARNAPTRVRRVRSAHPSRAVLFALMLAPAAALQPTLPQTRTARPATALQMVFGKTRESQKKFVPAVSQSELSPGKAVSGICAGLDICVAVDTDGSVYALGNKSPVLGTPMAAGRVANGLIKDPLTGTSFSVKSGQIDGPWCPNFPFNILFSVIQPQGLPVFKCKTGGGAVQVEVDVNAKTNFESGYWKGVLDAQGKTDGGYY